MTVAKEAVVALAMNKNDADKEVLLLECKRSLHATFLRDPSSQHGMQSKYILREVSLN